MIERNTILKQLKKNGILAIPAKVPIEKLEDEAIEIISCEDFLTFVTYNHIVNVFYFEVFYDRKNFFIGDDLIECLDEEISCLLTNDIQAHNQRVEMMELDKPMFMCLYTIFESQLITVVMHDDWASDQGILESKEMLRVLKGKHSKLVKKKETQIYTKKEKQKEQLKQYLLTDEKFLACTNKQLRQQYVRDFLKNPATQELLEVFRTNSIDTIWQHDVFQFIEMVWAVERQKNTLSRKFASQSSAGNNDTK